MDTKFEFLVQLDRDLRGAAARDRLAMEEAERRNGAGGGGSAVALGSRRGSSPAPRRPKRWAILSAASVAFLLLAGAVGFVATGGSPLFGGHDASPASGGVAGATGGAGSGVPPGNVDQRSILPPDQGVGFEEVDPLGPGPSLLTVDESSRELGFTRAEGRGDLSKIVRDGRIGLVVDDDGFGEARSAVNRIAIENEGFVLSSSTQGRRGTFVLRVPDRLFILTLEALGDIGKVEFEDQTGQDVTAEFVDLQARQEILQARKRVLLGFLREADTVQETLDLYGRVEDTQLQLERVQGQLRFIRDQVAESTVRVQIREKAVKAAIQQEIDNPSLGVAWERALQGFLNVVAAVVIGLGYLVPIAVIGLIAWLVVRVARKRSATA